MKREIRKFVFQTSFLKNIVAKIGFTLLSSIAFLAQRDLWDNVLLWLGLATFVFVVVFAEALFEYFNIPKNLDDKEEE